MMGWPEAFAVVGTAWAIAYYLRGVRFEVELRDPEEQARASSRRAFKIVKGICPKPPGTKPPPPPAPPARPQPPHPKDTRDGKVPPPPPPC